MATIDMVIVALYAVGLFSLAQWVSRDSGQAKTTEDYFLAGRTLPVSYTHLTLPTTPYV